MPAPLLNKTPFTLRIRRGLASAIRAATTYFVDGEPGWTTDTKQLYVSSGTFQHKVVTLDANDRVPYDLTFSTNALGPVLIDRTTGTKYRLYVNSGVLAIEVVP